MPTDRTGDVLTAEERDLCEHVRIDVTACVATIAEGKLLAIIDRLSAGLSKMETEHDAAERIIAGRTGGRWSPSARLAAAERVANAARDLRTVQRQRDRDEYEHCAAGATYGLDVLRIAEANLDAALAELEALK